MLKHILITSLLVITLTSIGATWLVMANRPEPKSIKKKKSLMMDTICITPHGHPVMGYQTESGEMIYVIIRHSDGYPIAITK